MGFNLGAILSNRALLVSLGVPLGLGQLVGLATMPAILKW
jgi:hypothetical protein